MPYEYTLNGPDDPDPDRSLPVNLLLIALYATLASVAYCIGKVFRLV
jgi:hypothetical protein